MIFRSNFSDHLLACELCGELAVRVYEYVQRGVVIDRCALCLENLGEGMRL